MVRSFDAGADNAKNGYETGSGMARLNSSHLIPHPKEAYDFPDSLFLQY